MGKGRNKNKNKSSGKMEDEDVKNQPSEGCEEQSGAHSEKNQSGDHLSESSKGSAKDPSRNPEPSSDAQDEITNGQKVPTLREEPENAIDQSVAVVQSSWRLWVAVAAVGVLLATMGHVTVEDEETLVVEKGVALTKTRARVFQLVGDLSNYNRWFPGIKKFDALDAIPMGAGKQFTEVIDIPLYGEMRYLNIVTGYESPHYVSFISDSWLKLRAEITVERRDSQTSPTSVKYKLHSRCNTYLCRYIVLPAVRMMYSNRIRQAMFNLRFTFNQ